MSICGGCGKSLEDGARFCTNCGIRVQAPTTVTDSAASSLGAAPAMAPSVPESVAVLPVSEMAPASSGFPFAVIISVVLILLIGAAVSATLYLHNQSRPKVEAQRVAASAQSNNDDDYIHALNLGSYPGASPVAIATLSGETVIAGFVTRDRPEQVMQYYKVRFPISEVTAENAVSHLLASLPNNQRIRIDADSQGTNTQVKIVRVQ
jgi:hypothetical protein